MISAAAANASILRSILAILVLFSVSVIINSCKKQDFDSLSRLALVPKDLSI